MNIVDALYEYAKAEIIPMIAAESEFTAGLLNGVLRTGRKKISVNVADNSMLRQLGFIQEDGQIDHEAMQEFIDGFFDGKESMPVSLAEVLKTLTGIDSENELLARKIKFTKADANRLLELLSRS